MVAAVPISTPMQAGEEVGWRGYLLPRLSARVGLPVASLMVGVIWACWHLPFFLLAGADKSGQPFLPYLLSVTALSVAMAWLYWRTQGSLLLTMFFCSPCGDKSTNHDSRTLDRCGRRYRRCRARI